MQASDSSPEAAALREVREETGYDAKLGEFAGSLSYTTATGMKVVLFWLMDAGASKSTPDIREVRDVQ